MSGQKARAALWQAMVGRAEALHELTVLSQARATARSAARLEKLAAEVATLARAWAES